MSKHKRTYVLTKRGEAVVLALQFITFIAILGFVGWLEQL